MIAVDGTSTAAFSRLHPHVMSYPQQLTHHTAERELCVELEGATGLVGVAIFPSNTPAFLHVGLEWVSVCQWRKVEVSWLWLRRINEECGSSA